MMTIHSIETRNNVIIPKKEFREMLEKLKKVEDVEVLVNDDPDYLNEDEIAELEAAEEAVKNGNTVNFADIKEKWLKGKSVDIDNN